MNTGLNDTHDEKQIAQGPLGLPLSHLGFCVANMDEAVEFWTAKMRAGPFFLLEPVPFDRVEAFAEPAIFEHPSPSVNGAISQSNSRSFTVWSLRPGEAGSSSP